MKKIYYINRNGKEYRVTVSVDDFMPILYVKIDCLNPKPFNLFKWKNIGARSELLNLYDDPTIDAKVNRMVDTIFQKLEDGKKEMSALAEYFSR